MSRKIIDKTPGPPKYKITYYGYGMTPMYKYIDDPAEAVAEFERMVEDPHAGASSLELIQVIMTTKYVF